MKKYLLALAIVSVFLTHKAFADQYKIFIDAGSTGSRLHLFKYNSQGKSIPEIKDIFSENINPGLSSFKDKPQEIGNYLKKLLNDAALQLQNQHINPQDVEVNVLATAGMRLLDESTQKTIYDNVKKTIAPFKIGRTETIPGTEEAVYGWLDVNYLAKNFHKHTPTIGTIDIGGASMQIAFVIVDDNPAIDTMTVTIDGITYTVFGKSFSGLGLNEARDTINLQKSAGNCYPRGYPSMAGAFDFATCGSLFAELIEKNKVSEQMKPLGKQEFYAFSGAFYTYKFFDIDKIPNKSNVEKHILNICTKSWEQLSKEFPSEAYLSTYCSNGTYLHQLFYNTYHLHNDQLSVLNEVNAQAIDWTMGAMLFSLIQHMPGHVLQP